MNTSKLSRSLLAVLLISAGSVAQQQDTLSGIRSFLKVCNVYKELPLQLEVQLQNSTNFITSQEDTVHTEAKFYLQQEGSYVSFGELEQLANDSVLLLVSNALKRMIVYPAGRPVASQLKQYMGIQFKDSSLLRIAARYTASGLPEENTLAGIELKSRARVPNTTLPKEEIRVRYKAVNGQPSEIIQLTRRLVPVEASAYEALKAQPEWAGHLLSGPDGSFFIIKEQVCSYVYRSILHTAGLKLPVQVSDRIAENGYGKYSPVKAFGDFLLSQDF